MQLSESTPPESVIIIFLQLDVTEKGWISGTVV